MEKEYDGITVETMMGIWADHNGYRLSICCHYDLETPRLFNAEALASFIMVPEGQEHVYGLWQPVQAGVYRI